MRKKFSIGNNLWIIEGATRWAIYDLLGKKIIQISKEAGNALVKISNETKSSFLKRRTIREAAPDFYCRLEKEGCFGRLFQSTKNTSLEIKKTKHYMLWVELTNSCNQRCLHCYAKTESQEKNFLSDNVLFEIIYQASVLEFEQIQFTGGEPFLHPKIWEAIKLVRKINRIPVLEIYTNLTLLKKENIDFLKKYQVKVATTLLGSSPKVHESCTKTLGSFSIFLNNIRLLRDNEIDFRIGVVCMPENQTDMENIKELMIKEGLILKEEEFMPDDVRPVGCAKNYAEFRSSTCSEVHLHINPEFFHTCQEWNSCWGGELAITSKGEVIPCVFAREQIMGNVYFDPLEKIIKNKAHTYWKITSDQIEKCQDCEFRYACMDCRVLPLKAKKGIFGSPERCNYNPYQ